MSERALSVVLAVAVVGRLRGCHHERLANVASSGCWCDVTRRKQARPRRGHAKMRACSMASLGKRLNFDLIRRKKVILLDLCVSSLRRGHANLLCIVPSLVNGTPFRGPDFSVDQRSGGRMNRAENGWWYGFWAPAPTLELHDHCLRCQRASCCVAAALTWT
jgi:hypothetical protein